MKPADLTAAQLAAAMECSVATAQAWRGPIEQCWALFEITSTARQIQFCAQVGHESAGLTRLVESFNYAAESLVPVFGRHRITPEQAKLYGRRDNRAANQQAIANIVYGGAWGLRNLGNTEPGDGWKYRGRGPIQVTGLRNTLRAREGLRSLLGSVPDFVEDPDQLVLPLWGALSAGLYWSDRRINEMADAGEIDEVTRAINGGDNGIEDRRRRVDVARAALA